MSSPYDQRGGGCRRRYGARGHWVTLTLTVMAATVGLAAWIWSQQRDDEHDDETDPAFQGLDFESDDCDDNRLYGANRDGEKSERTREGANFGTCRTADSDATLSEAAVASGLAGPWGANMSGALRRTPSPQQFFDSARKTVAAGVTAAGMAMGSALAAIREEDKTVYADHATWSEEADAKKGVAEARAAAASRMKRRAVAVIVSAENHPEDVDDEALFHEHASILSHIPRHTDFSAIKLFVLIYAPGLKDSCLDAYNNLPPPSLSSSYSNIEHNQAQTLADGGKNSLLSAPATDPAFNVVYSQALALVEKESMVLPFTTPNGHVHMLRHLQPETVYLQESLSGENGSAVANLQTWLRHDVVVVVGAESGHGGLADSESEAETPSSPQKWWQREDRVGRGRGVIVVDGMRVHDDWARRVQGKE